jgi:hypothetical protein
MAEGQDHPFKPKRPKEGREGDSGDRLVAHTSQNDATVHGQNNPGIAKQIGNGQVGDSGQAEYESDKRKPKYNHISHGKTGNPESKKKKGKNYQTGRKQIQRDRSQAELKQTKHGPVTSGRGVGGPRISGRGHGLEEIEQRRDTRTVPDLGNKQRNYSEVARPPRPQSTKVRNTYNKMLTVQYVTVQLFRPHLVSSYSSTLVEFYFSKFLQFLLNRPPTINL